MPSVPGEFDASYGLADDEKAAIAALAPDKTSEESPEEKEDREREEAERLEAEKAAVAEAGADEASEHAADTALAETEADARAMGWVPLDEFKGDKAKWRDAKGWLERGFANPYILKSLNDRLKETNRTTTAELADLKRRLDESTQVVRAINARAENADLVGYNRGIYEAKIRQKEAVGEADTDKYDQATADLEALEKAGPPKTIAPARPAGDQQRPQIDPDVAKWSEENKWFRADPELGDYAGVVDKQLQREYQAAGKTEDNIGARAHLDEVARRVKLRYADHPTFKNENPRRAAPNSVRQSGGAGGANGAGTGNGKPANLQRVYANLPAADKVECDRSVKALGFKKDGKTPWLTRQQWVERYDWPQEFY